MNYQQSPTTVVAHADAQTRATFIKNTYLHLAAAVFAFAFIEYGLIKYTNLGPVMMSFLSKSAYMWFIVLGGYMGVSFVSEKLASSSTSKGTQYTGLSLFVVGEAIIFIPMIYMATQFAPNAIGQAAIATAGLFLALTVIAFTTKADFSFLGGMLKLGFIVALALIGGSVLFGFDLGTWFSGAMILLAGGSLLYNTSNIIHRYHSSQYVIASLGLFASIMTIFWYVLRILMSRD